MEMIHRAEARKMLEEVGTGKIFTVIFRKRTNNELRTMNCRRFVKKGVNGKGLKFNPKDKGLITVYDMQAKAHRMINLEAITLVRMNGAEFDVVD